MATLTEFSALFCDPIYRWTRGPDLDAEQFGEIPREGSDLGSDPLQVGDFEICDF